MVSRKQIARIRKVNISSNPDKYALWEVQYSYDEVGDEWYDLLDDPPEWLCDLIIEELSKSS